MTYAKYHSRTCLKELKKAAQKLEADNALTKFQTLVCKSHALPLCDLLEGQLYFRHSLLQKNRRWQQILWVFCGQHCSYPSNLLFL